uniref:Si:ch211-255g12.6 n=1 Tax=Tetraodon nigroviridis TaxID=99883 RepID=H3D4N9_TETNG
MGAPGADRAERALAFPSPTCTLDRRTAAFHRSVCSPLTEADCKPHLHPSPSVVQSLSIFPPPHLHLSPPPQIVPSSLLAAWKKKNKPDHGFELKKKRLSPSLMEFH